MTSASGIVMFPKCVVPLILLPSLKEVEKKQPLFPSQQSPHAPHACGHATYAAVVKHSPCRVWLVL